MIQVFFSHLGEPPLSGIDQPEEVRAGSFGEILGDLESRHHGLQQLILDAAGVCLNSAALVFKHIEVDADGRLLECEATTPIRRVEDEIAEEDGNLLIALFHPERLMQFLLETLTPTEDSRFHYAGGSVAYRSFVSSPDDSFGRQRLFARAEPEELYPFTRGRAISEYLTDGVIDVGRDRLVPIALRDAIAELWEIKSDFRLRLFQEEALVHILRQLARLQNAHEEPLLLSIPTGGGKTEAFLIPLISHLYDQRERCLRSGRIPQAATRAMVLYPTRALANDQARRVAEILFRMNQGAVQDRLISVGVLTGDTPESGYNLQTEKSLLQVCPRCSAVLTKFQERTVQGSQEPLITARCICGAEIDCFRLTRSDILHHPPDILITSPDMINRVLQSPRYRGPLVTSALDVVVLDEVHMYESVFGCNVAHLLRRLEQACHRRPLYVGVSATIRNAKELACLLFDADAGSVRYLRPRRREEAETPSERPYLDFEAGPARHRHHYATAPVELSHGGYQKATTSVLNLAHVIGHLIRDPHFRKTLIFSNFRQDTDDILRFLRDQEDRYYSPYLQELLPRLAAASGQASAAQLDFSRTEAEIIAAVHRWHEQARRIGCVYQPNIEVGWHRGGLEREERIKAVNRFASTRRLSAPDEDNSELPIDVMVATSTLELGIDIGDVTTVANCGAPFTTNEYTQRVGRGGRRQDSLALTVIDRRNPLDLYFLKHFDRYAHPGIDDFEDAPIIISNVEVMKSHVYARLLDCLAHYLEGTAKTEVKAEDLRDVRLLSGDRHISFSDSWEDFAQALFEQVFPPDVVRRLQNWIEREATLIPGIHRTVITSAQLRSWWMQKCERLYQRICSRGADIADTDDLSGLASKDRELVPDMRSSGPSVGLYLAREGREDELRDTVSRRQAITSRPVGGYASQGSMTFKIESVKDRDPDTEERVKSLLVKTPQGPQAVRYFSRMFGDRDHASPFPGDPVEVLIKVSGFVTPRNLLVKYSPYRFYCPRCGATYSDKAAGDDRCTYCHRELRQLTEVYLCGGCGEMYLPPVPKVCVHPECIAAARSRSGNPFAAGGYKSVGKGDRHNEYFRFTALPMLGWKCRQCGTTFNYHAFHTLPPLVSQQVAAAVWGFENPAQIAKNFLFRPESWYGRTYAQDGFHQARFSCSKCKKAGTYRQIHVKNVPSFRSVVHEYIIHEAEIAPEQYHALGASVYERASVIALARERFRRFYSYPTRDTKIDLGLIFPDGNYYLANAFTTHAVFVRVDQKLSRFLQEDQLALSCLGDLEDCACRIEDGLDGRTRGEGEADEGAEMTRPVPALLPWERDRKPDPRRKWCDVVRVPGSHVCPAQEVPCARCSHFDRARYLRYVVLHTLKHAIILAMPKYTGVNKNMLRGIIYPNDETEHDIGLVDLVEGGSGCLYLLRKNWDQVWDMAGELLDAAQGERGELLLPYTCSRYNRDLCPRLALAFYRFVSSAKG